MLIGFVEAMIAACRRGVGAPGAGVSEVAILGWQGPSGGTASSETAQAGAG